MLSELRISGMGVIDEAVAEFAPGLSVLTGETGAGKTMVVTGLRLLTGVRADASRVRRGASRAVVEGHFELADLPADTARVAAGVIEEIDGDIDEGAVVVTRRVGADGRSRAHLAGRGVPAGRLSDFCAPLLTVHGQNDQLRLLRPDAQRDALDAHGGAPVARALAAYRKTYGQWRAAEKDLARRTAQAREMAQEADLLKLGLGEIDALDPQPGEDHELDTRIRRLTDSEELRLAAASAHAALTEGDEAGGQPPIASQLDLLAQQLTATGDEDLRDLGARLGAAVAAASDVGNELGAFLSSLEVDDDALEAALSRRHALKALTRKYGEDIASVLEWAEEARNRLSSLDTSDEAMDQLKGEVKRLRGEIVAAGKKLRAAREKAATSLSSAVTAELAELSMGSATLEVRVAASEGAPQIGGVSPTENGIDVVTMLLVGAGGAVPLDKGASGGELSRVMLALEVVLAAQSVGGTLVFDEVDAGVGGRAALAIGRKLALLAKRHQVLAVTHLAQVAAYADTHLVVRKNSATDGVISGVEPVKGEDRIKELARMLAGMDETDSGLAHARDLLEKSQSEKLSG